MLFWRKKKEPEQSILEKIVMIINDPLAAVLFSIATTLTMAGFTSGKFLEEYNTKLDEAITELKTLQSDLREIELQAEKEYYPRAQLDLKIQLLEQKIQQLEGRIAKLESSDYN